MRSDLSEETELDWAALHDVVVNVTGQALDLEALNVLFESLPRSIRFLAYEWGLSDTVFRDEAHLWLQKQKVKNAQNHHTPGSPSENP